MQKSTLEAQDSEKFNVMLHTPFSSRPLKCHIMAHHSIIMEFLLVSKSDDDVNMFAIVHLWLWSMWQSKLHGIQIDLLKAEHRLCARHINANWKKKSQREWAEITILELCEII